MGDVIQADYAMLEEIAACFQQQSDLVAQMHQIANQCLVALESGGWRGRGASAFFQEMQDLVLPSLKRLIQSFHSANSAIEQLSQTFKNAEEESGKLFMGAELASIAKNDGSFMHVAFTESEVSANGGGSGPTSSGPFRLGPPTPPNITHDNGFLDNFARRNPELGDYLALAKWRVMLEASEAFRPDLTDANAAYRHFLDGNGADRTFSYERFVENDPSGAIILNNLIADAQHHVEILSQGRTQFSITSDAYAIREGDPLFPYPKTENWQKTIGAHHVWTSADVTVSGTPPNRTYTMVMTVHAEDRYNFNPNQNDIATGIPDSENGVFEITGLANQYMNRATLERTITWQEGDAANAIITDSDPNRNRQPEDNRRLRNRV